jgi:hypothetical protein
MLNWEFFLSFLFGEMPLGQWGCDAEILNIFDKILKSIIKS